MLLLIHMLLHKFFFFELHLFVRLASKLLRLILLLVFSLDDVWHFSYSPLHVKQVAGGLEDEFSSVFELVDGELSHFVI